MFGPLFGPLLVSITMQIGLTRGEARADAPISIAVSHAERAPNLVAFLAGHAVDVVRIDMEDAAARAAILDKRHKAILLVPEDYGARLAAAQPAPLLLYADASDIFNDRYADRLRGLLNRHSQGLAQLRLLARGVDPAAVVPIAVQDIDVSTPSSRAVLVLGSMSFLIIFAMLTGRDVPGDLTPPPASGSAARSNPC